MLPPDFKWVRKQYATVLGDTRWLYVGDRAVALVTTTIQGQWYTLVNRHKEPAKWLSENCASYEQGKRWIERWALAGVERLRRREGESGGAA